MSRYYLCGCCGARIVSTKPQDPERDQGYGTCDDCKPRVVASCVKHGGPGSKHLTLEEATARYEQYA